MNDNATQEWALFGPENYSAPDSSRLGELLHEAGLISSGQAEDIARHSEAHKLRFGEAAVALGYVTQQDLDNALATQFDAAAPNRTEIDEQLICFSAPASQGADDVRSRLNAGSGAFASTQVSLLPPPCCIETTRLSMDDVIRLNPPGITM